MSSMPVTTAGNESFFQTWLNALTKPREETYSAIGSSPRAKATTGYLWVFLGSIVSTMAGFIAQSGQLTRQLEDAGVSPDQISGIPGGMIVALLCSAPFLAVFATLFYAVWVALMRWIAKMFGGIATNDQMAYTLAAIGAPYAIISAVFALLSAIPFVGLCFGVVLALGGLYVLVLNIMAIKAVNRFGWGPAIGTYAIPGLALLLVVCCVFVLLFSVLGLAVGDVWSTMNLSSIQ